MTEIIQRLNNGVLELTLNRPEKRNALTEAMYVELHRVFNEAKFDDDAKVVLLSGQKFCFTAGNDLNDFLEKPFDDESPVMKFLKTMADFPKPVVAAVNGPAVGIGTTLLLHCDLVYSGDSAVFQLPFVNLGLVPEFASSVLLPLRVGHNKAAEWLMLGKSFGPQEALQAGLINAVFGDENYLNAANQQAQLLAAQPTEAIQATKRLMKQSYMSFILNAIDDEAQQFMKRLKSDEFKRAAEAFLKGKEKA
ncbi:enoyl-CoA hydratase [Saccharospirillum sp. MSK14-1]|uniref:enoyl-CoA hydratase n=1 Tax=Saccharospirillum sp. MSK14-1 TaxID=1897632 RepID=UPI000D399E2D|nr:enoyl-CoA hydratase [Saccharospirillum sp. MSK14-1]PTY36167.1 enoyl-CoA hydratase [Saccharospirillum sp. MSK14-1]